MLDLCIPHHIWQCHGRRNSQQADGGGRLLSDAEQSVTMEQTPPGMNNEVNELVSVVIDYNLPRNRRFH